jgi:hypothetical protein
MPETYANLNEQAEDKARLMAFLYALDGAKNSLRLDECRLWTIRGQHGYISTWGDGQSFLLFVQCHSPKAWTFMKRRLSFCIITQDGDDEGCLKLSRLPTIEEAVVIRAALRVHVRGAAPANAFNPISADREDSASGTRETPLPDPSSHLPSQKKKSED